MPAERSLISAGSKQLAKTAQTQQTLPPWLISHYRKRREDHERWSEPGTPFPVGQKKVFLPDFTVTLQYNPRLPPTHAQFDVPLHFSKLDLRDYLWHAYSVRTLSIRSQVVLVPIRFVQQGSERDIPGKKLAYRPRSLKRMTVRLEKPFVWPELDAADPKNEEMFSTSVYSKISKDEERLMMRGMKNGRGKEEEEESEGQRQYNALRRRANELFEGTLKWKSPEASSANNSEERISDGQRTSEERSKARTPEPRSETMEEKVIRLTEHQQKVLQRAELFRKSGVKPASSRRDLDRRIRKASTA